LTVTILPALYRTPGHRTYNPLNKIKDIDDNDDDGDYVKNSFRQNMVKIYKNTSI
jgi:hypothetical protein